MLSLNYKWILSLVLLASATLSYGQQALQPIYIQVEEINSTDLIKYYLGQTLTYSTKEYPDTWRKSKIVNIIPEDNLIVLQDNYLRPEEIHSLQRNNKGVLIFGHALSKFAAGWLVFGAYASIADQGYKMSWTEVVIGVVAAFIGKGMRKLFGKKKYPMDKFYRVRIMDIRFPQPKFETP